jgi:CRP/FNR family transcriptional regulator, cyclic AMP receptor protein
MHGGDRVLAFFRNKTALEQALLNQKAVQGNRPLARDLAQRVKIKTLNKDEVLIEQGADEHDVYFILKGQFEVSIHGRKVGSKGPGEHVGETAAILTSLRRSATVQATSPAVVAKLELAEFKALSKWHKFDWHS